MTKQLIQVVVVETAAFGILLSLLLCIDQMSIRFRPGLLVIYYACVASGLRFQKTRCLSASLCRSCKHPPSSEGPPSGLSQFCRGAASGPSHNELKTVRACIFLNSATFTHPSRARRSEVKLRMDVPEAQPLPFSVSAPEVWL